MIKPILCIVCGIWLFVNDLYCQDQKVVDSLKVILENQTGSERYPGLHRLAVEYVDADNQKAFGIIQQAEQAALLSGDSLWIVKSKRAKGQILFRLGRFREVISSLSSALSIAQRQNFVSECMRISNTFGSAYLYQSQFDKALQYYFQTHEIAKKQNDAPYIAVSLNNIGITYYKLKDYKKGLPYLKRSLVIEKSIDEVTYNTPMNLSLCYSQLKDFKNARIYLQESINICGSACSHQSMTHIKYAMGCISLGLKQYDKAETEFLNSYTHSKIIDDYRMQMDNIYLLAEIYIKQKSIKKAVNYLDEGEKIIQHGVPFNLEMIKIYSRFSELYMAMNDFEKASFYQSKYIELKDSIFNEALTTSLMKTEAEYMERENKAKITAKDEIILLKEEVINRQVILNVVTGLLGLITMTFLIFIFRNYRKKKNLNVLLDQKIKERTRELELSRNELLTALKERDLIIRHASDGISETLSTIEGLCYTGIREVSDPVAHSYLDRIDKTVCRLADYLRSVYQEKIFIPS